MSKRPNSMSDHPDNFPDGLTVVLAKLGLKGEIFLHAELCGQWAMDTSGQRKVPFHLVERGTGWLHTSERGQPRLLGSGDFVVFPHDAAHCISGGPERPPDAIINQIPEIHSGQVTSLLCGFFEFQNRSAWPLLDSLPDVIVLDLKEGGSQHSAYPLVQLMITELQQKQPGMRAALNRLAYLLFIQILRMQISSGTTEGMLFALADNQIGAALNRIHHQFRRDWTVAELAKEIGMSRSVFSQKFVQMTGKTPMRYLAEWRILEASEMLRTTDASMATIAESIGYGSETAFRKAFRKIANETPGDVRRRAHRNLLN